MKQVKKFLFLLTALIFTNVFFACGAGDEGNTGNVVNFENNGVISNNNANTVLCTYVQSTETSNYYIFYADKTVEGYVNGKLEYPRSTLSYTGTPNATGTVTLKTNTGTTLLTFKVAKNGSDITATAYIGESSMGGIKYTVKTDSSGTNTSGGNAQGGSSTAKMFMGFDNVVTILNGTDTNEIKTRIYALTSDTTLKFNGGINGVTLTTVAGAMGVNDSVKLALDFSEATGITTWRDKLAGVKTLHAISLPKTVTSVQENAFYDCMNLKAITIPKTTTYPSEGLNFTIVNFTGDLEDWLQSSVVLSGESTVYLNGAEMSGTVTIPDSVTSIKENAFQNCAKITSIVIPNSVTSIGNAAFNGCTAINKVIISDGSETLTLGYNSYGDYGSGKGLFYDCPLETLYLGRNISYSSSSGHYSPFLSKTILVSVQIGNKVTSIGNSAFSGCSGLTSITIPDSVTSIGNSAFSDCSGLTSITIPNGVTSIGDSAFSDCSGLTSITIPGGVTSIGDSAFNGCTAIKKVIISDGSETLTLGYNSWEKGLFYDCPLETLYLGRNISYSSSSGHYSPFLSKTTLVSVQIGNKVTSIGSSAFSGCSGLTNITIPDSVTSIGSSAFYGNSRLTTVNYRGSEVQWKAISIDSYNSPLTDATIYTKNGDVILPTLSEPQNVTAEPSGLYRIDVHWKAVNSATCYVIYYRPSSEDGGENSQKIETRETYITIEKLLEDKTYDFWVTAKNSNGESGRSDVVSARSYFPAPGGVSAYAQGTGYARVSWNQVKGATKYEIYAAKLDSYGKEQGKTRCTTSTGNSTVVGLTSGAEYNIYVRAVSGTKTSGYSKYAWSIIIH